MHALFDPMTLPGGVRIPHEERGDPRGTPVVLLHDIGGSADEHGELLPHLDASLRTVVPAQRGHAGVVAPAAGYGVEHLAGDLRGLLDSLAISDAIVVARGYSGWVAARAALERPERVAGLVLVGTPTGSRPGEVTADLARRGGLAEPARSALAQGFASFDPAALARPSAWVLKVDADVRAERLGAELSAFALGPRLADPVAA